MSPEDISPVEPKEFARFLLSGLTSTFGNLLSVWLARFALPYEAALLVGIAVGVAISYLMSKLFAFRARRTGRTGFEFARFLTVYAAGCIVYWNAALALERVAVAQGVRARVSEMLGVLVGAGLMMIVTYLGHRFFTYRTYRRSGHVAGGEM